MFSLLNMYTHKVNVSIIHYTVLHYRMVRDNKRLYCGLMIINLDRGLKPERVTNNDIMFVHTQCLYTQMKSVQHGTTTKLHKQTLKYYVEIKCQLDATEVFIADIIACSTCFGHHYAHHQEIKSIIQWLLRVVFCVVVFQVAGLVWS